MDRCAYFYKVNFYNTHLWKILTSPWQLKFQNQLSITVWTGLIDDNIVGPCWSQIQDAGFWGLLINGFFGLAEE